MLSLVLSYQLSFWSLEGNEAWPYNLIVPRATISSRDLKHLTHLPMYPPYFQQCIIPTYRCQTFSQFNCQGDQELIMFHFLPLMGSSVPARTSKPSPNPSLTASFLRNRHQLPQIGFSRSRHLDGVWDAGALLRLKCCERKGVAVGRSCTTMQTQLVSRKLVGSSGMCVVHQSYLVDGHSRASSLQLI